MTDAGTREQLEWAVIRRPRPGERSCGDLAVVAVGEDVMLVAGIDGVGHGSRAARAARRAAEVIERDAGDELPALAERCHEALRGTRGAALSLARLSIRDAELTWLGIGNVEGRVIAAAPAAGVRGSLLLTAGVPGHELPDITTQTLAVRSGDVMILATDGVRPGFADDLDITGSAQEIGERVMGKDRKGSDDALVVVVRYLDARR